MVLVFFFFNDTATTEIYTLSLHDALPILVRYWKDVAGQEKRKRVYERICPISGPGKLSASERERKAKERSEEHTSELQSRLHLVCRLLLEKKKEDSYLLLPMIQAVIS